MKGMKYPTVCAKSDHSIFILLVTQDLLNMDLIFEYGCWIYNYII